MTSTDQANSAQTSKKNTFFRLPFILIAVVAMLVAVAWGLHWWLVGRFVESTDNAYLKADAVVVSPKVGGYVAEVMVKHNQVVKKGMPLVRLDAAQYRAAVAQAKGQWEASSADLVRARADIVQQQAKIEQTQAQEAVARLAEQHARDELARYTPLGPTGATSDERLAELRNNFEQARANLAASGAEVKSARSQLSTAQAAVAQAQAQQRAADAARQKNTLDLDDTVLRSAQDGRVGDLSIRVGQLVQPGARLMSIVPLQQLYLGANFKETQIARMRVGQPVEVHVDAFPDQAVHGTVDSFSPGTGAQFALLPPENATGNFTKIVQRVPVYIRLQLSEEQRQHLLPGLSVTADVDTRGADRHG